VSDTLCLRIENHQQSVSLTHGGGNTLFQPFIILIFYDQFGKGHYKELFEQIRKKGYLYVRIDGEVREITHGLKLDRYKNHDIEVVCSKSSL